MFVVDTSIHFSILYPIGVLLCSLFIVKSGGVFLMERTMSVEEKIKRAEEIYNRRKGQ